MLPISNLFLKVSKKEISISSQPYTVQERLFFSVRWEKVPNLIRNNAEVLGKVCALIPIHPFPI